MSVTSLVVAVRTTGHAGLTRLAAGFATARTSAQRLGSTVARNSRSWTQHTRAVSSVRGAYRDASGLWRNANGTLLTQRHTVRQVTTAFGRLAHMASSAGRFMSTALSSGIGSAVSQAWQALPPQAQAAIVAAGVAMAVILASAVGAALDALLLAAIGGGVLAAGIAVAVHDPAVRKAFGGLGDEIKAGLKVAAEPMVAPLIGAARIFRVAWQDVLSGDIRTGFATLSSTIEPLARGLAGMATNAMPGFNKAIVAAQPILKELARLLPGLGSAMSDFFSDIAGSKAGALKGLRVLFSGLSFVIRQVGFDLKLLSGIFDFVMKISEKWFNLVGKIPILGAPAKKMGEWFGKMNKNATEATPALDGASGSIDRTAEAAEKAADQVRKMSEKLGNMINDALGVSNAAIAWEEAIDGVTESVKENGRNIDIGTAKGRENVKAVNEAVAAARRKCEAAIQQAGGEKASKEAVEAANAAFQAQIGQLEATLKKAGLTQEQIDQLIGSYKTLATSPDIQKNINIDINYRTRGEKPPMVAGGTIGPGNMRMAAGGGTFRRGESAVVGEKGWELVTFGKDAQVHDHRSSMAMVDKARGPGGAAGAAGGTPALVVHGGASSGLESIFLTWLDSKIRKGQIRVARA